ncbi:hypothetical protein SAMN05444921_105303 [Streptomyces wuyuanensis]|uniref:Uncharacterized protein n=1 Tax=Streptomyces wuyuanensis TaxID=1196353 RepID=A0A1G9RM27_9ACTN|nr:hypothetical protein SAMN05444921_105303 [Streptomyces wuyuanensis]
MLPGRGPAGRAPGRGAWRSPPGRAAPGRAPPPCPWPGRAAGRGPGVAPGRGPAAGAAGGAVNSGAAGAAGAGFGAAAGLGPGVGRGPGAGAAGTLLGASAAAGLGAGAPGLGAAGRAACAGEGPAGVGAPPARLAAAGEGADLRGAAGFPAERFAGAAPEPCWKASVSLRTTGASIVEDAERTNSPSSWSLAMTTLLSTPNSLASSYTRTLATSLLLGPGCPPDRRYFMGVLIAYSSSAHRNLDLLPTREVPDRTGIRAVLLPSSYGAACAAVASTARRTSAVSSGPWTLRALGNARRRTARSRQTEAGCT